MKYYIFQSQPLTYAAPSIGLGLQASSSFPGIPNFPGFSFGGAGTSGLSSLPSYANGGSLGYNFQGSQAATLPGFGFPNFGSFPQFGNINGNNGQSNAYIPPVSKVLKEGLNAFLPAGAKKYSIDKAHPPESELVPISPPELAPILTSINNENAFDAIRQIGTNPLQASFSASIDDPSYSPLSFPSVKSGDQKSKELVQKINYDFSEVEKHLTPSEKETKKLYESIEGISPTTLSIAQKNTDAQILQSETAEPSNLDLHEKSVSSHNYVSHTGFPISETTKLHPLQTIHKITAPVSTEHYALTTHASEDVITKPDDILEPELYPKQKQHLEKTIIETSSSSILLPENHYVQPKLIDDHFLRPRIKPENIVPYEESNRNLNIDGQNPLLYDVNTNRNDPQIVKDSGGDLLLELHNIHKDELPVKNRFHLSETSDSFSPIENKQPQVSDEFRLKPLPRPPIAQSPKLYSGSELLSDIQQSYNYAPLRPYPREPVRNSRTYQPHRLVHEEKNIGNDDETNRSEPFSHNLKHVTDIVGKTEIDIRQQHQTVNNPEVLRFPIEVRQTPSILESETDISTTTEIFQNSYKTENLHDLNNIPLVEYKGSEKILNIVTLSPDNSSIHLFTDPTSYLTEESRHVIDTASSTSVSTEEPASNTKQIFNNESVSENFNILKNDSTNLAKESVKIKISHINFHNNYNTDKYTSFHATSKDEQFHNITGIKDVKDKKRNTDESYKPVTGAKRSNVSKFQITATNVVFQNVNSNSSSENHPTNVNSNSSCENHPTSVTTVSPQLKNTNLHAKQHTIPIISGTSIMKLKPIIIMKEIPLEYLISTDTIINPSISNNNFSLYIANNTDFTFRKPDSSEWLPIFINSSKRNEQPPINLTLFSNIKKYPLDVRARQVLPAMRIINFEMKPESNKLKSLLTPSAPYTFPFAGTSRNNNILNLAVKDDHVQRKPVPSSLLADKFDSGNNNLNLHSSPMLLDRVITPNTSIIRDRMKETATQIEAPEIRSKVRKSAGNENGHRNSHIVESSYLIMYNDTDVINEDFSEQLNSTFRNKGDSATSIMITNSNIFSKKTSEKNIRNNTDNGDGNKRDKLKFPIITTEISNTTNTSPSRTDNSADIITSIPLVTNNKYSTKDFSDLQQKAETGISEQITSFNLTGFKTIHKYRRT